MSAPRRIGGAPVILDDGYTDNLLAAEPLLRQYDVPATVFVASGYTDRGCEFWWDELERIVLGPDDLPARLTITLAAGPRVLDLGASAHYSPATAARHMGWRAYLSDPPPRDTPPFSPPGSSS